MSRMQWLIEAKALSLREKEENERQSHLVSEIFRASARTLRETLVHVLGTNIGAGKPKEGEMTPSIPLIATLARGEVIEELLQRESEDTKQSEALRDEEVDAFNEQLMELDMGDLEPIFTGKNSSDPFERWASDENLELMRAMGVELVGEPQDLTEGLNGPIQPSALEPKPAEPPKPKLTTLPSKTSGSGH